MSNTISSALSPARLVQTIISTAGQVLAQVPKFATVIPLDKMAPKVSVEIPICLAGPTVQENATDFESGDTEIDNIELADPPQLSVAWHSSPADRNNGFLAGFAAAKATRALCAAVIDKIFAQVTSANFGAAQVTPAGVFGQGEFQDLLGIITDPNRVVLLSTAYWKRVTANMLPVGWSNLHEHTRWNAAEANTVGFAATPDALIVGASRPADLSPQRILTQEHITLGDVGLPATFYSWAQHGSRVCWYGIDTIVQATPGNTSGLKILASA
jgi:hypothetical protein